MLSIVRAFYVRCENSVLHPGADTVQQHLYGCLLDTQGKGGYLIVPWRFWNMETGVIIILWKKTPRALLTCFSLVNICQEPHVNYHAIFSQVIKEQIAPKWAVFIFPTMPQAFASASNPHNFLSLSLYRDFVKERGLSERERSYLQHNSAQVVHGSRYEVQRRQGSLTNVLHFPESHPPWTNKITQFSISIQYYFLYSCRCILLSSVLILAYMHVHACVCTPNSLF